MTRHLARWELAGVGGAVVVVDVIRAFTTAAYAFASGAAEIYLFASVDEALAFKAEHPGSLAMGEERGLRPDGFDLPNSPAMVRESDLDGRSSPQLFRAHRPSTRGVSRPAAISSATRRLSGSWVRDVEHLELFPGDRHLADHAPPEAAARAGPADLDPRGA